MVLWDPCVAKNKRTCAADATSLTSCYSVMRDFFSVVAVIPTQVNEP